MDPLSIVLEVSRLDAPDDPWAEEQGSPRAHVPPTVGSALWRAASREIRPARLERTVRAYVGPARLTVEPSDWTPAKNDLGARVMP